MATSTTRVKPNPARPAVGALIRFHDGEAFTIEGPTDIPTALATRLLKKRGVRPGQVVRTQEAVNDEATEEDE